MGNNLTDEQKIKLELLNSNISRTENLKKETNAKLQEINLGLEQMDVAAQEQIKITKQTLEEQEKIRNCKSKTYYRT